MVVLHVCMNVRMNVRMYLCKLFSLSRFGSRGKWKISAVVFPISGTAVAETEKATLYSKHY